ncbi:MAG: hypothetical protein ACT4PV_14855 [Planctomycetaceae bacterium]
MIAPIARTDIAGFAARLLEREGALVEPAGEGALFTLLPTALRGPLELPESAVLRVEGEARAGETPLALESRAMQWCVDRAVARGRRAAVRVPARPGAVKSGETAVNWLQTLNATVRHASVRTAELRVALLEFRYEARSEERAEGGVFVAVEPTFEAVSLPLARALRDALPDAEPVAWPPHPLDFDTMTRDADPTVRVEISRELDMFRKARLLRLEADRERLLAYHETLVAEASRRRGGDADKGEAALRSKIAAVVRRRDERLAEIVERHSVHVGYTLASVLLVSYTACVHELTVRRRDREITVPIAFDPLLREPLPRICPACRLSHHAWHVCDEAGHLTCATCAARCGSCGRVTCRACHGPKCRGCARER